MRLPHIVMITVVCSYCYGNYCMLEECVEWSSFVNILCSHVLVSVDLVWFASN